MQPDGTLGRPPTQLVAISTLGTERTNQFPYTLQNVFGNLEQRRQVEEVVIQNVKKRMSEPPLDYTIIKLGQINKDKKENPLELAPGDALDQGIALDAAVQAIVQAIAYQPNARNSTLSVAGNLPEKENADWNTLFLPLDGPELWRSSDNLGDDFDLLLEYLQGWADLTAQSGKGLTTPIMAFSGLATTTPLVQRQDGFQLLFLPTNTGSNYQSKSEERQFEKTTESASKPSQKPPVNLKKPLQEGGLDVAVELVEDTLRVRARRCAYGEKAIVKELSEETLLKRLQDALDVFRKERL